MSVSLDDSHLQLLDVSAAQKFLLAGFAPLAGVWVPLIETVGRVLAKDIQALSDLPPFPNSAMDGFAVRAADVREADSEYPVTLRVVADVPAGQVSVHTVESGQAIRIMTGAAVPAGADAVVPVEHTDFNQRQAGIAAPERVQIFQAAQPGENVRPSGQDVRQGELVMQAGHVIRPQDAGFLSMLGFAQAWVHRRPRVAVFSSGDELLPPDQPLTPGKIHDANTYTLLALVEEAGGEAVNLGIIPDQPAAVEDSLSKAVALEVDLILSSAGVSVGALDFVRSVVERHGRLEFWRVNMRPGKPLAFGSFQNVPFVGLPGNPVSAFVGFEVFVRPALLKMQGKSRLFRSSQRVQLAEAVESDGRESYLRAVVKDQAGLPMAWLTGHQGSGNLRSLVQANALLVIPSGVKSLPPGSSVDAWMLGDIW